MSGFEGEMLEISSVAGRTFSLPASPSVGLEALTVRGEEPVRGHQFLPSFFQ